MNILHGSPVQKIRIRLSRRDGARFLSHLEQIELLRQTFRRLSWPAAFGAGRRPQMRLSFGPAISVGYESEAEYCDLQLVQRMDLAKAKQELDACLPAGYTCLSMKHVPIFFPSLEELLNLAVYRIGGISSQLATFQLQAKLREETFQVVKKKTSGDRWVDAKTLIRALEPEGEHVRIYLRFGPQRTLKPELILQAACGLNEDATQVLRVCRLALYMEKPDGTLLEP